LNRKCHGLAGSTDQSKK